MRQWLRPLVRVALFLTAALLAVPAAGAHTFEAPESIYADADGCFVYTISLTITEEVLFGGTFIVDVENTTVGPEWADGFCESMLEVGQRIDVDVQGCLVDDQMDGVAYGEISLCPGFFSAETTIHPITSAAPDVAPPAVAWLAAQPNPARAGTVIRFELGRAADVRLVVLDVHGRVIDTVHEGPRASGEHAVSWDVSDVAAGVYFVRLTDGMVSRTIRVVRLD